ncbi:hypothetical protein C1645_801456 [Glomus cerebriforme]|uniref:C2H2-type domain-containing protein n=1 Tax=Glomus cerebriforme TaxID=658196 RepID=A0A397TJ48_9GLOM|nr:hypothetical protein C1645_801456 [Glomus cerebriforme]
MPHATECAPNINPTSISSSPIQIPISASTGYGCSSSPSSYNTSTVTLNDYCNQTDNMNVNFDQSYQASSDEGSTYTPTITSDPVARNLLTSYPRDYNCCGTNHQNLIDFYQHVDTLHPGWIMTSGGYIPFETDTVYSQDRWDPMSTIPIHVAAPLTTNSTSNSLTNEQKNINFGSVSSTSLYSLSLPNNKQKSNLNNNGFGGYNQNGVGFDDINGMLSNQSQDLSCENFMLYLMYDNKNPLRDPNFSSTLFGDQTLSSNPSSISTSLEDDNSLFDIPSKALQMNQHQDPLLVSPLLSIPSYPPTPNDYVEPSGCLRSVASSPISSDDNVSPNKNEQTTNSSNTSQDDGTPQRRSSYTSYESISSESNTDTYDSINNNINSRQRPISSPNNDHVTRRPSSMNLSTSTHQLSSFDNIKNEQGSIGSDANKSILRRSPSNHRHSYGSIPAFLQTSIASNIDSNSISQPRRSSTTLIPITTQNEQQYRSPNIGQPSSNNVRPITPLRRSSTSNLTPLRTSQAYISIDKSTYMPSVTTAQYSVEGYSMVTSGETGSGSVTPFSAKYPPIQPKAVAMSDVYSDPALDKNSKKRTVSTSSLDIKSIKRRVTKSSDESIAEAPVAVPADLSEVENRSEADIYPYKCVVPGCPKVYKNANGLKYHNEHGHASQSGNGAREKPWGCHVGGCLKTYGSKGGLIYHVKRCHPNDLWALP